MLTIVYDSVNGVSRADGNVIDYCKEKISRYLNEEKDSDFVVIGSENLVYGFRLLVKRNAIDCNQIQFMYKDKTIKVYNTGALAFFPEGFCDFVENALLELID